MIGDFGDAEVFSFHATKFLNAFEGGMVTTNDSDIARKVRSLSNFGYSEHDDIEYAGTNGKMSEISAAMGLTGLESMDSFIQTNHQNYLQYKNGLQDISGIHLIDYAPKEKSNYQYIMAEIDRNKTNLSRDNLHAILTAENILARKYFSPGCHRAEPYLTEQPDSGNHLPITEDLCDNVITFPNGTAVSRQEIDGICQLIKFSIQHAQAINELIATKQS